MTGRTRSKATRTSQVLPGTASRFEGRVSRPWAGARPPLARSRAAARPRKTPPEQRRQRASRSRPAKRTTRPARRRETERRVPTSAAGQPASRRTRRPAARGEGGRQDHQRRDDELDRQEGHRPPFAHRRNHVNATIAPRRIEAQSSPVVSFLWGGEHDRARQAARAAGPLMRPRSPATGSTTTAT